MGRFNLAPAACVEYCRHDLSSFCLPCCLLPQEKLSRRAAGNLDRGDGFVNQIAPVLSLAPTIVLQQLNNISSIDPRGGSP
jgi:hypothetical protein